ncbi:hypothetical protein HD554DRAFT_2086653 [Boletus coccyginus]|nr:hypothetical protein HD554DRAFT_2086653 [Boletus coccyginus]
MDRWRAAKRPCCSPKADGRGAFASSSGIHPLLDGVRLKGGIRSVMQTMVELFSAQMFSWG